MNDLAESQLLQEQLRALQVSVPQLLRRHAATRELANDFAHTLDASEAPFTLAVAGQMRVGKSTLINALIGADLAISDVTETTATVNWFRYGTADQAQQFRVVWNDLAGTTELLPLTEKERWSGNSEQAQRTRYLEFFGTAEFLRRVHLADTPGTRSTIASHQQVAREFFLSIGKAERDTLFYGGMADCFAYVLPPVPRQNDANMLVEFAANTRLPQSTPYNSVGLLHKWETLQHPAPWLIGEQQAKLAFESLQPYVSAVLPVSGPLGRACQTCPAEFWDLLWQFGRGTTPAALELLADDVEMDEPGCSLTVAQRRRMRSLCPIAKSCFKTLLLFACSREFADPLELQREVRVISGIDAALEFLQLRFFERSRLIRCSTLLGRALRISDLARGRIRNQLSHLAGELAGAQRGLGELGGAPAFPAARAFIERHLNAFRAEHENLSSTLRELEGQVTDVRQAFELLERDCVAVQILDEHGTEFTSQELLEILRILGAYGGTRAERLGLAADADVLEALHERLDFWLIARAVATGRRRQVIDQVVARIEGLLV